MDTLKSKIYIPASAIAGIIFGILSNYSILKGSWMNLFVWAGVGLLIGLFIENKKYVTWSGIAYGFFVTLAFLISGFQGTPDKLLSFSILTIILSLIGALCGFVLVFVGNFAKVKK